MGQEGARARPPARTPLLFLFRARAHSKNTLSLPKKLLLPSRPAQPQRAFRPPVTRQDPLLPVGHHRRAVVAAAVAQPAPSSSHADEARADAGGAPTPPPPPPPPSSILPATAVPLPAAALLQTHVCRVAIRDFALVPSADVALTPGLTVVTGESGAGKSVLLSALALALGGALPAEAAAALVRPPATSASVEATLTLAPGDAAAVGAALGKSAAAAAPAATLTLRRELSLEAGGHVRSRCFVNGAASPLKALKAVGALLADINGQGAAAALRDAGGQARLLDALAGTAPAAAAWRAGAAALRVAEAAARPPSGHDADGDADARRDALQAMVDAVSAVGPAPGEDATLRALIRAGETRTAASESAAAVAEAADPGGSLAAALADAEALARSAAAAERAAGVGGGGGEGEDDDTDTPSSSASSSPLALITDAAKSLAAARAALATAGERSAAYARGHRRAAADAEAASSRLAELKAAAASALGVRAGSSSSGIADALLAAAAAADAELQDWGGAEARRAAAAAEAAALRRSLAADAAALSAARRAVAGRLRSAVGHALAGLGLPQARFEVRVGWTAAAAGGGGGGGGGGAGLAVDEAAAAVAGEAAGRYAIPPPPPPPPSSVTSAPVDPAGGGLDTVEFLWAAGPAEALRPLAAAASGGEAARVALALRAARGAIVAADADALAPSPLPSASGSPPILVVDELDAGVGGRLGDAFGRTLSALCGGGGGPAGPVAQVLAVSHLPQVAAHADVHLRVAKKNQEEGEGGGVAASPCSAPARTVTGFEALVDEGARRAELAAMLGPQFGAAEADALLRSARAGGKGA